MVKNAFFYFSTQLFKKKSDMLDHLKLWIRKKTYQTHLPHVIKHKKGLKMLHSVFYCAYKKIV